MKEEFPLSMKCILKSILILVLTVLFFPILSSEEFDEYLIISSPTSGNPVNVGSPCNPSSFSIEVVIISLEESNFEVYIGEGKADIEEIKEISSPSPEVKSYEIKVQPPVKSSGGKYDLEVRYGDLKDIEENAVIYQTHDVSVISLKQISQWTVEAIFKNNGDVTEETKYRVTYYPSGESETHDITLLSSAKSTRSIFFGDREEPLEKIEVCIDPEDEIEECNYEDNNCDEITICEELEITNLPPSHIKCTSAMLNGKVVDTGCEEPTVYVYWGETDGGTEPEEWDNCEELGTRDKGAVSKTISGLEQETTYYYRFYAVNSKDEDLADETESFTTPECSPGKTFYVKTDGNNASSGESWEEAKATIQNMINEVSDGDTILVEYGTYEITIPISFGGKDIKLASDDGTHNSYESATRNSCFCTIDAGENCRVFTFESGETPEAVVNGFTIKNGKSDDDFGGGIYCEGSSPRIIDCCICNNLVDQFGGGIACKVNSSPEMINCIITKNEAKWGGGIYCWDSSLKVVNCTIVDNFAKKEIGGGIYLEKDYSITITNSILWGNAGGQIDYYTLASIEITYSDIEGGYSGEGNINLDPKFVNAGQCREDYYLSGDSLCIAAGITTEDVPDRDIIGNPRPNPPDTNPDMGAYELGPPDIEVCPTELNFGCVPVGKDTEKKLTIRNVGDEILRVDSITSDNPVFTVISPKTEEFPQYINSQDYIEVAVRFSPQKKTTYEGILTINSDDPDEPVVTISLKGIGGTLGDVSDDDKVTAYDSALIFQYITRVIGLSTEQIERADLDCDKEVTVNDAELILKKVVGLID